MPDGGARFSGDGAWNTRAARRACEPNGTRAVTREASDEVPYRDPAPPQSPGGAVAHEATRCGGDAGAARFRAEDETCGIVQSIARSRKAAVGRPRVSAVAGAARQCLGVKSPVQYAPDDRKFEPIDPAQIPDVGATLEDDALLYEETWRPSETPAPTSHYLEESCPSTRMNLSRASTPTRIMQ